MKKMMMVVMTVLCVAMMTGCGEKSGLEEKQLKAEMMESVLNNDCPVNGWRITISKAGNEYVYNAIHGSHTGGNCAHVDMGELMKTLKSY